MCPHTSTMPPRRRCGPRRWRPCCPSSPTSSAIRRARTRGAAPPAAVVAVVRERAPGAVLHTDAVQAFPWVDVAALAAGADLVAVAAHKFGGPKGVGALVVREGVKMAPLLHGGGQERDRRSGTHNVAGIVAMAAAMQATVEHRAEPVARVGPLRHRLVD